MITAGQLPDLMTTNRAKAGPTPFLKCDECYGEYSANRGDYWNVAKAHVMTCCGEPMRLMTKRTLYVEVNPDGSEVNPDGSELGE
jgi:hypothetical protein